MPNITVSGKVLMRCSAIICYIILLGCAGCIIRPAEEPTKSKLLQLPEPEPARATEEETPQDKPPASCDLPEDRGEILAPGEEEPIVMFSAIDPTGIPEEQHWSEELGSGKIVMKKISEWDDGSRYHVTISFTNSTDESVNANLNLYAYDRLGRLVRSEFAGSINFRPRSVFALEYNFAKRGREVRWILNLTGKN